MTTAKLSKGTATRALILQRAMEIVQSHGLDGLTIGGLAEAARMSKSGVFAHFGSREDLQLAVLDAAAEEFTDEVFVPALAAARGLPRLRAIVERWKQRTLRLGENRGCPIGAAAIEFDDRPGPVHDRVMAYIFHLRREIARAVAMASEQGHIASSIDPGQIAFEVHGLMLAFHFEVKLGGIEQACNRVEAAIERLFAAVQVTQSH